MTIKTLLECRGGIEALGQAKFKDGKAAYDAMKTVKAFNESISVYQAMVEQAQIDVKADKAKGQEWADKLNAAQTSEAELKPWRKFTLAELIPEGNPHGITGLHLADLDRLGILAEA